MAPLSVNIFNNRRKSGTFQHVQIHFYFTFHTLILITANTLVGNFVLLCVFGFLSPELYCISSHSHSIPSALNSFFGYILHSLPASGTLGAWDCLSWSDCCTWWVLPKYECFLSSPSVCKPLSSKSCYYFVFIQCFYRKTSWC